MKKPKSMPKIDAADALNWEYLCQIAENVDPYNVKDFKDAMRLFAYDFTSTASVQAQNDMLASLLQKACYRQSVESNEEVVKALALALGSSIASLRQFAKQSGIALRQR